MPDGHNWFVLTGAKTFSLVSIVPLTASLTDVGTAIPAEAHSGSVLAIMFWLSPLRTKLPEDWVWELGDAGSNGSVAACLHFALWSVSKAGECSVLFNVSS